MHNVKIAEFTLPSFSQNFREIDEFSAYECFHEYFQVHQRDVNKFQQAYCNLLKSNMDGLKRQKKTKTKKATQWIPSFRI